jgi:signal transduction histidine kinase
LTFSARLSIVFSVLLLASSGVSAWLQIRSNALHEQQLVQRLSSDLAEHIAGSSELMDRNGLKPDALRILFGQLMTVNPSVEVYLLDASGGIVGHAAPPGHVRRTRVDVEPIERLLAGEALPIFADDPRSDRGRKVFSAARLQLDGHTWGYVYVILMGEARDLLAADVAASSVLRTTLRSMGLVALLGLTAGLVAFRLITRPLGGLTEAMHQLDVDGLAYADSGLRVKPLRPGERDEITILENAFGRMAARIADQWRALTQQDQERRDLIANVSHDLRTPLTSLHGYLETLAFKADALDETERRRYLGIALAQSAKVGRLASELFELARLEHGAVRPDKEVFSLADLVQDVLQKLALLAAAKRQQLIADVAPGAANVVASLPMIERVLTNLLDNAIRYTPEEGEIAIGLSTAPGSVEVTVSDTGPGIPVELRDVLFRRPPALGGERREDSGGLGLLIVRRILELHDSRIERVDSTVGATFRFRLEAASFDSESGGR